MSEHNRFYIIDTEDKHARRVYWPEIKRLKEKQERERPLWKVFALVALICAVLGCIGLMNSNELFECVGLLGGLGSAINVWAFLVYKNPLIAKWELEYNYFIHDTTHAAQSQPTQEAVKEQQPHGHSDYDEGSI